MTIFYPICSPVISLDNLGCKHPRNEGYWWHINIILTAYKYFLKNILWWSWIQQRAPQNSKVHLLIVKGQGVTIFCTLLDVILSQTNNNILDYISSFGSLRHKSNESANEFKVWSSRLLWEQMYYIGYMTLVNIFF